MKIQFYHGPGWAGVGVYISVLGRFFGIKVATGRKP